MELKKPIVKNTGFSYIEVIYGLLIIINLFVLSSQIFYNINIKTELNQQKRVIEYEVVSVRIESQLKEASDLNVSFNELSFRYRNQLYKYLVFNNNLTLQIDYHQMIYYLYNIESIEFHLQNHMLIIIFEDLNDYIYESRVLLP